MDTATPPPAIAVRTNAVLAWIEAWMPVLVLIGAGLCLPLFGDSYLGVIGTT